MTKDEARSCFLQKRLELSDAEVEKYSFQIFSQWKKSELIYFNNFHIFLSIKEKKEINTRYFIDFLWANHKEVYCSKAVKESLLHYELTSQTVLKENSWGIPEPFNQKETDLKRIDCVFIPLLAYDVKGNRVGYGKGYYDRFLKNFPHAKKIGLSFFDPLDTIEGLFTSDIPLDYIITPAYFLDFPMEEK